MNPQVDQRKQALKKKYMNSDKYKKGIRRVHVLFHSPDFDKRTGVDRGRMWIANFDPQEWKVMTTSSSHIQENAEILPSPEDNGAVDPSSGDQIKLTAMNKEQLVALAKENGIDPNQNKPELLTALQELANQ